MLNIPAQPRNASVRRGFECPETLARVFKAADASTNKARALAGQSTDDIGVLAVRLLKAAATSLPTETPFSFSFPAQVMGWVVDGKIQVTDESVGWMVDALKGADASRIKLCEVKECGKPFWATRTDQRGCSREHRRLVASRQWHRSYHQGNGSYKAQRYKRQESNRTGGK